MNGRGIEANELATCLGINLYSVSLIRIGIMSSYEIPPRSSVVSDCDCYCHIIELSRGLSPVGR